MQGLVATALAVAAAVFVFLGVRGRGAAEFWGMLAAGALLADTFVIKRARVLTIPFFFTLVIILLFWSARRSAERQDQDAEQE